jgi:acyl carrier protein
MDRNLTETVAAVIAREQKCDPNDITLSTRLTDLGIDSLRAITILYELEEEFGIEIPNEIIETIDTVGDIVDRLKEFSEINTG